MMGRRTRFALVVVLGLLATACSQEPSAEPAAAGPPAGGDDLAVAVASFDLAVGEDERFIAGVLTPDRRSIAGGTVEMAFAYLPSGDAAPQAAAATTGRFLPVPGKGPERVPQAPTVLESADGIGVYETAVDLDRPGFWQVTVTAEVDGETRTGTGTFEVLEEHQVPTVGEAAPRSDSLTIHDDAPPAAIDSRAASEGEVPDPELHDISIADAIAAGRPTVVVFSTPVYCVSRFCGPITDAVQDLAGRYGDRAEFIHVEIWEDFDAGTLNPTVSEWILPPDGNGGEPWVFLIGADGTIAARWDNVLDEAGLAELLEQLPAS